MTNIEHAIENAISAMERNQTIEQWLKWQDESTLEQIKATPEELWNIAEYVLTTYTEDYYCRLADKFNNLPEEIQFIQDLERE